MSAGVFMPDAVAITDARILAIGRDRESQGFISNAKIADYCERHGYVLLAIGKIAFTIQREDGSKSQMLLRSACADDPRTISS